MQARVDELSTQMRERFRQIEVQLSPTSSESEGSDDEEENGYDELLARPADLGDWRRLVDVRLAATSMHAERVEERGEARLRDIKNQITSTQGQLQRARGMGDVDSSDVALEDADARMGGSALVGSAVVGSEAGATRAARGARAPAAARTTRGPSLCSAAARQMRMPPLPRMFAVRISKSTTWSRSDAESARGWRSSGRATRTSPSKTLNCRLVLASTGAATRMRCHGKRAGIRSHRARCVREPRVGQFLLLFSCMLIGYLVEFRSGRGRISA